MQKIIELRTPFSEDAIKQLKVGDVISISGDIFCGRDAVLPRVCKELEAGSWDKKGIDLKGGVIFHTAVSPAGVGPTSSNKLEIEGSFEVLSKLGGIKMHLGKGAIKPETVKMLAENNAVFAIIPPVTALLESQTLKRECVAWPELGMEALYRIKVKNYQVIIAAANGKSIYE
ncbi:fumarate hydratase subunit beta [Xylanibacter ruminicola]|uniref:Fumarate hydratase subunit beta n=1 Tax=Xylanibacter ruminicola TaxID=839 RepID=A0A1H5V7X0_XYLRU|nr:fumarate hydratase C-terminal domain-containing protein [Xylanibacter ruminicola]SEF83284.1 fumarate hydratase subunit beta [Xylanibacter ruminicola]